MPQDDLEPVLVTAIPQLLTGLCRPEAHMLLGLLRVVAEKHPQALLQSPFRLLEEYYKGNVYASEKITQVQNTHTS